LRRGWQTGNRETRRPARDRVVGLLRRDYDSERDRNQHLPDRKSTLRTPPDGREFPLRLGITLKAGGKMRRLLSGLVLICTPILRAQGQVAEYAVKIVCGVPDRDALAPGKYFTAINVHNPSAGATKLQFKVALTTPTIT